MSKAFVLFIFSMVFMHCFSVEARQADFPRDTSYTLQSAYQKYVKDYPEIEIANPELNDEVNIQPGMVFKNTGKRGLHLDVFSPKKTNESLPSVLLVHGGGWISGDKSLLHPMAEVLASEGFVAITVEYRLSPEAEYPAAVYDIKSALKWVKDHATDLQVDSGKVAILGTSAGGQLAALVGTTQNDPAFEDPADASSASTTAQAIVDIDGVLAFIHPDSEEGTVAGKWLGGNQQEAREKWIEASALTHVDENTPPMLFIGSSFPRFLAGSEEVIGILDQHETYHQTYLFEAAPHSFWLFHPWFEPTMDNVVSFLRKNF